MPAVRSVWFYHLWFTASAGLFVVGGVTGVHDLFAVSGVSLVVWGVVLARRGTAVAERYAGAVGRFGLPSSPLTFRAMGVVAVVWGFFAILAGIQSVS
jgi:hypothetical protein